MTTTRRPARRGGFTLIEILVTLAIFAALLAITGLIATTALNRDRTAAAANQLEGRMQIARSRAHRDGLPHGIRLIVNGSNLVTAYQYIHSPGVIVPPTPLGGVTGAPPAPYVQFEYAVDRASAPPTYYVTIRQCRIYNLTLDQQAQVLPNSLLFLPELGTTHRIESVTTGNPTTVVLNDPTFQFGYPDDQLGAATHLRTYNFGLYAPPSPLVGEEVMQLPEGSCVDLSPGRSLPQGNGSDYDILFAPNGKLVSVPPPSPNTGAFGHLFLWIRNPDLPDNLLQGGSQFLVVVKGQSGACGIAPVDQTPDNYALGRQAVAGH